jgi:hypothetical protein
MELNKRDFLKMTPLLGASAAVPALAAGETPALPTPSADLIDDRFESASGQHFGTQVIHHGEQTGYQITPISQDKAAPGYQRPGNLGNPTVAALLRKVMAMEGAGAAVAGLLLSGLQTWRLSSARAEVRELQDQAAQTAMLRALDDATIRDLQAANQRWADSLRAGETAAADAVARVEAERDRLARELNAERRRRAEIYKEDADARAWSDAAVPAAVARGLSGAD